MHQKSLLFALDLPLASHLGLVVRLQGSRPLELLPAHLGLQRNRRGELAGDTDHSREGGERAEEKQSPKDWASPLPSSWPAARPSRVESEAGLSLAVVFCGED